jgi:hypothetical protein
LQHLAHRPMVVGPPALHPRTLMVCVTCLLTHSAGKTLGKLPAAPLKAMECDDADAPRGEADAPRGEDEDEDDDDKLVPIANLTKANAGMLLKYKGRVGAADSKKGDPNWTEGGEFDVDMHGKLPTSLRFTDLSPDLNAMLKSEEEGGGGYICSAEVMS